MSKGHFGKKISKREAPDSGYYTLFNSTDIIRPQWGSVEFYQTFSIDPATKNCALRIERWFISGPHQGMVKPKFFGKYNFIAEDPINCNLMYQRAIDFFSKNLHHLSETHYIISERQLHENYKALRMSSAIIGALMVVVEQLPLNKRPIIVEVAPQLKGVQLGAPKGLTSKQLKVWVVPVATEILQNRGDEWSLDILKKEKKKDDLSDVIAQVKALFDLWDIIPKFKVILSIKQNPQPPRLQIRSGNLTSSSKG